MIWRGGCGKGIAPLPEILHGRAGILMVGTHGQADMVVSAAVGVVGLEATYEAISAGKVIALSNKEVLVAAGELVMAAVRRRGVEFCRSIASTMRCTSVCAVGRHGEVRRIVLTASGGPFRKTPLSGIGDRHAGAGAGASQLADGAADHASIRRR